MLSAQTANKRPPAGHFKYRHLFLTGLAPGKSKFKMLADLFSGESSPGFQTADFLLCPHMAFLWYMGRGWGRRVDCSLFLEDHPALATSFTISYPYF